MAKIINAERQNRNCLGQFLCLSLIIAFLPTAAKPQTKPPINNFSIFPEFIDVTSGADSISIAISIGDGGGVLTSFDIILSSPSWWDQISYSNQWGSDSGLTTYIDTISLVIPQYTVSGEWHVGLINVVEHFADFDINWSYYEYNIQGYGFTTTFEVLAAVDTIPPTITSLVVNPAQLDVTTGNDSTLVTFTTMDQQSGIGEVSIRIESPSQRSVVHQWRPPRQTSFTDSAYYSFNRYWETGEWMANVSIRDRVGNTRDYASDDLQALGFAHHLQLIAEEDSIPPAITNFELTPSAISLGDTVWVSLVLSDSLSGLERASISFSDPSGSLLYAVLEAIDPGINNDTLTGYLVPHSGSLNGDWRCNSIYLTDQVGNWRRYYTDDLVAMDFPTRFSFGYAGPVFHVNPAGDDTFGDGTTEAPFATIQRGIDSATDGDTVLVAEGTYAGEGNKRIHSGYVRTGGILAVLSEDGPSKTIIDCENDGYGFRFTSGSDYYPGAEKIIGLLSGFTIRNGRDHRGGGLRFEGEVSPIIENCIIENCVAESRYIENGIGGGIFCNNGPSPTFVRCIIRNNIAESYEGMGGQGGGAYIRNNPDDIGTPTFINTLIYGNIADPGTGNYSSGGGLYFLKSDPEIVNCTIAQNSASEGAGIYIVVGEAKLNIRNSILWGNSSEQMYIGGSASGLVSFSNIQGGEPVVAGEIQWLEGNIDIDPLFENSASGDFHLQAESPAIDAGDPDPSYNDPEDPSQTGLALWPALGTTRNDMGAYGGGQGPPTVLRLDDNRHVISSLPGIFDIHQNYPNPFNPTSTIQYDLPEAANVTLVVYDILGREVVRLVDQQMQPGYHRAVWDAKDYAGRSMPTGIYIARILTLEYTKSIKMLLLK